MIQSECGNFTIRERKVISEVARLWPVYDRCGRLSAAVAFTPFASQGTNRQKDKHKELKQSK